MVTAPGGWVYYYPNPPRSEPGLRKFFTLTYHFPQQKIKRRHPSTEGRWVPKKHSTIHKIKKTFKKPFIPPTFKKLLKNAKLYRQIINSVDDVLR